VLGLAPPRARPSGRTTMARYLLTGVAGFIASRVAHLLLADGHTVVGVDNLNSAYDVALKRWRLAQIAERPGFSFHQIDIAERGPVAELFGGAPFDAVINLAARAGVRYSVQDPWVYVDTNVTGTLNLLERCAAHGVKKFVLASTSSLYGGDNPTPYHEGLNTDRPLSPYAASKKAAEALCATYHHLFGIDTTVLRYFTVYGPAGRPDMSPFRFVQRIVEGWPITVYGDGKQSRDFTYVDDIARGTVAGLTPVGYEIINLGSDTPIALMSAIHLIEELVGRKAEIIWKPRHPADMDRTWADVGKAQRLLNWRAEYRVEQGFRELVDWYRDNRSWAKDIATTD
jgi:UDP-glucuronate 4-epimerase